MPFILFALALAWAVMLLFGGGEFDRGLMVLLYAGDDEGLGRAAVLVTELGGWRVLVPAAAAGALWLLFRGDWRRGLLLIALVGGGRILVGLQKDWTARIRPDAHEHLTIVQSLSFPSGHAANATVTWFALAFLLARAYPARGLAVWAAAFAALAAGISRVMLGVHWPSDVIGGWAFGLFWTLLMLRLSGDPLNDGTRGPARSFFPQRSGDMTDRNERSEQRAETAREHDDSDMLENAREAPSHGDRQGQRPARDVGTRDELKQNIGEGGVTRVRAGDKEEESDLPRFNRK